MTQSPDTAVTSAADTHEVLNQPTDFVGYNAFSDDRWLSAAHTEWATADSRVALEALGREAGSARARAWAEQADRNSPELRTHDRFGHRIDEVEFHPAWHELMRTAVAAGLHGSPWVSTDPAAHAARAVGFMTWYQVEAGHGCPISMTYAVIPALRTDPALAAMWEPGLTTHSYDFGLRPASEKHGLIAGMAMTEKQGGSDVRSNTTRATALAESPMYSLTGHKWFCSAPMSDVFLVLAQAPGGLTCFVVPRVLPDGNRNVFRIQRLKDKLGNRSNASSEIELAGTIGWRLGDEGRGVRTIVEMVSATRLDCVLGSAALMRRALSEALWYTSGRKAFGHTLVDAPLMQQVLADLALEAEAAVWLGMKLAHLTDLANTDSSAAESAAALRRIALPMSKYYVCKRAPYVTAEALECLGGAGYVEESGMPRLYREAPVNSVWEGSGSINALDLLRAVGRSRDSLDAYLTAIAPVQGTSAAADAMIAHLLGLLGSDPSELELHARTLAEGMALLLQAATLIEHAPDFVAEGFLATRINSVPGALRSRTFGAGLGAVHTQQIVERALVDAS